MKARNIIEAESPQMAMSRFGDRALPYRFVAHRLTPDEQERIADILAYGPVTRRPSDQKFINWGWIEIYDGDETAVEAKTGFAKRFYSHPEISGAVHPDFTDVPHWRGNRKTYRWRGESEDPKRFLKRVAPRQGENLTVSSSHGTFDIDGSSGRVIRWWANDPHDADAQAMENIERFDLHEWKLYWQWKGELPGGFDVLDLGFWTKDGAYEQPEDDWREEMKRLGREWGPGNGHVANPE